MPNVSSKVFQSIQGAATTGRNISAQESAKIKEEIQKDGVTPDESAVLDAMKNQISFTVTSGKESITVNPSEVSFPRSTKPQDVADDMVDNSTSWGNLRENELGQNLAKSLKTRLNNIPVVQKALEKVDDNEVNQSVVDNLSNKDLKTIAEHSEGKNLLGYVYDNLDSNRTHSGEGTAMQRIAAQASTTHGHLAGAEFNVPPKVTESLKANNAELQPMSEGTTLRSPSYDTYEVTVRFKDPAQAKQLFEKFARNPNSVGDDDFDAKNDFTLRGGGLPEVGDIYDIDIQGPDNGSIIVMSSSMSDNSGSLVINTINDKSSGGYGAHPENGAREFGFRANKDGTHTFYTKGASRGNTLAEHTFGAGPQKTSWTGLMNGFKEQAEAVGAQTVGAIDIEKTHKPF